MQRLSLGGTIPLRQKASNRALFFGVFFLIAITPLVSQAQRARSVTIVGNDYAFRAPDTLRAGPVIFGLVNHGTVRHEVVVVLLKPGRTVAEYVRTPAGEERRALADDVIGLIIAQPGRTAPGRLLVDLVKGRTYGLICNLRDAPDKPQHTMLGMMGTIFVR